MAGCNRLPLPGERRHAVGERVAVGDTSVAVKAVALRLELVGDSSRTGPRIYRNPSGQWLLAAVDDPTTFARDVDRSLFSLRFGDHRIAPFGADFSPQFLYWMGDRPKYRWDLALPLPAIELDRATIVWQHDDHEVHWTVPDSTLERATALPEFVVRNFSVPPTIVRGEPIEVSATIENQGDRPGVANLVTLAGPPGDTFPHGVLSGFIMRLGWDESETIDWSIPADYDAVGDQVEIELRSGAGTFSQTVDVES